MRDRGAASGEGTRRLEGSGRHLKSESTPWRSPAVKRTHAKSAPHSRGQSLVEFALILPVLLLLVLSALDMGRVFMGWVALNNAARVGANYAGLHAEGWDAADQAAYTSLVTDARDDAASALSGCDTEAIPPPTFPNGTELGDFAEVVLDCDFHPLTPIIGDVFASTGNKFGVSARSVFPIRTGIAAGAPPPPPPSSCLASFSWSPINPVAGEVVTFTDSTAPTASGWTWTFGDGGAAANTGIPSHTYGDAGTYTVQMSSASNGTPCTPYEVEITVSAPQPTPPPPPPNSCLASFTWSPINPVAGEVVTFTDSTPPAAGGWTWTFGDGGATATTRNPSHTYAAAGSYTVGLTSKSDGKDCTLYEVEITVSAPPPSTCKVPGFSGSWHYDAQKSWADAGFTTPVQIAKGDNKVKNWIILWQDLIGGQDVACNATITISANIPKKP